MASCVTHSRFLLHKSLSSSLKTVSRTPHEPLLLRARTHRVHASSSIRCLSGSVQSEGLPPRRAFMYVPGDSKKKIIKASHLAVDCVCLDMEDGVAEPSKDQARELITDSLDSVHFNTATDVCVRINPVSTQAERAEKDIEAVFSANKLPSSICLPKVESVGEVEWLCNKLYGLLQPRPKDQKMYIILMCESPRGFLNLPQVCTELDEISTSLDCNVIPDSIVFGSDDYCAAIGATRTDAAKEILYARQKMIMICKMFNLQAIDMVYNNFKDTEGLTRNCIEGRNMGYTGKQVIHPGQVDPVQAAFAPSAEQIAWARGLVAAFESAERAGAGAINFQGRMVDMPLVHQARNLIRVADKFNIK